MLASIFMTIKFSGFDWDNGNADKCRKHGVSTATIEQLFLGPFDVFPDPGHSTDEVRYYATALDGSGRRLLVVFTLRHKGNSLLVRPISARYMHKKESEHYEKAIAQTHQ
jgi:uncharacterized DUF497 family protein